MHSLRIHILIVFFQALCRLAGMAQASGIKAHAANFSIGWGSGFLIVGWWRVTFWDIAMSFIVSLIYSGNRLITSGFLIQLSTSRLR
jgi:hypothetical protein